MPVQHNATRHSGLIDEEVTVQNDVPSAPDQPAAQIHLENDDVVEQHIDFDAIGFGTLAITPNEEQGLGQEALVALLGDGGPKHQVACQGPWHYMSFDCFQFRTGPACGILEDEAFEDIVEYNGCTHASFGQVGMSFNDRVFFENAIETEYKGDVCRDRGSQLAHQAFTVEATQQCTDKNTAAMQGPMPGWSVTCSNVHRKKDPSGPGGASCRYDGVHSYIWWSADLTYMQPEYAYRESDPACGRKVPVRTRKIKERSYKTCRHANFGRELHNVCPARENDVFSERGISYVQLITSHAFFRGSHAETTCLTCEPLPYDTQEHTAAKLQCLARSRNILTCVKGHSDAGSPFAQSIAPAALLSDVAQRVKALFEARYTETLTGDDVLSLYLPDADRGPSDISYQPGASASQSSGFKARMALCQALLHFHVDPQRLAAEYQGCLGLTALTDSEKSAKVRIDSRIEALKLGVSLFARYVRSMQGGPTSGFPEAENAMDMAQSWYEHALHHVPFVPQAEIDRTGALMRAYAEHRIADLQAH